MLSQLLLVVRSLALLQCWYCYYYNKTVLLGSTLFQEFKRSKSGHFSVALCLVCLSVCLCLWSLLLDNLSSFSGKCPPGEALPYKGLMGTCGQQGYVFRDFCLKQGIEFIIVCLNQGVGLPIFVLNTISFLGQGIAKFLQALVN